MVGTGATSADNEKVKTYEDYKKESEELWVKLREMGNSKATSEPAYIEELKKYWALQRRMGDLYIKAQRIARRMRGVGEKEW